MNISVHEGLRGDLFSRQGEAVSVEFVLLEGFPALALTAAMEPLVKTNQSRNASTVRWRLLSTNGGPVTSQEGWVIPVDGPICAGNADISLVLGDEGDTAADMRLVSSHIRRLWRLGKTVGGMCGGLHALARAGILGGRSVSLHWQEAAEFLAKWPMVTRSEGAFFIDDRIISCASPLSAADLMLQIVSDRLGKAVTQNVMDMCLMPVRRSPRDAQTASIAARLGTRNPALLRAVEWIDTHYMDEDCLDTCIEGSSISARQLQRLFQRFVGVSPLRYLAKRRLENARSLLLRTDLSIQEVAEKCGFSSTACLSRGFRQEFGVAPSKINSQTQVL